MPSASFGSSSESTRSRPSSNENSRRHAVDGDLRPSAISASARSSARAARRARRERDGGFLAGVDEGLARERLGASDVGIAGNGHSGHCCGFSHRGSVRRRGGVAGGFGRLEVVCQALTALPGHLCDIREDTKHGVRHRVVGASKPAMSEIRVDPLSGLRTIVAPGRAERSADPRDPFAEGNESLTPPELYAVRPDGGAPDTPGWRVRVVPNSFPALARTRRARGARRAARPLHRRRRAPAPTRSSSTRRAPCTRSRSSSRPSSSSRSRSGGCACARTPQAACLHLFVNEGAAAGASREHTHAQLLALDFVPALIARERERFGAYATRTMGGCCSTTSSPRRCAGASASSRSTPTPCCSRRTPRPLPYQLMLVPRRPRARFEDDGPDRRRAAARRADAPARAASASARR